MKLSHYILLLVGLAYGVNGLVMLFAPHFWYLTVPGIVEMGDYHRHLIRDVGLVYLIMGGGFLAVVSMGREHHSAREITLFACLWPSFHGVYHMVIFFDRGMPLDTIALTNFLLIQIPAWLSLWAAWSLPRHKPGV